MLVTSRSRRRSARLAKRTSIARSSTPRPTTSPTTRSTRLPPCRCAGYAASASTGPPLQDRQEYFEGRDHGWEVAGRWFNIVLVLPFVLVTLYAVMLRRSRLHVRLDDLVEVHRFVPSLALISAWLVTIALSLGSARFRAVVEPSFAVLAGFGYALLVQWVGQRGRRSAAS